MDRTQPFIFATLAIGVGFVIASYLSSKGELGQWFLVYAQFGLAYLIVGALVYYERKHHLSTRRLLALLTAPGLLATAIASTSLVTPLQFDTLYPETLFRLHLGYFWLLSAFFVPLQYGLARIDDRRTQWGIAGSTTLFVVAMPVSAVVLLFFPWALDSSLALLAEHLSSISNFVVEELGPVQRILVVDAVASVVPYAAGSIVKGRRNRRPSRAISPASLPAVAVPAVVLVSVMIEFSLDPSASGNGERLLLVTLLVGIICSVIAKNLVRYRRQSTAS